MRTAICCAAHAPSVETSSSAGVSIYSGNAGPFIAWVKALVDRTIKSLVTSAGKTFPAAILSEVQKLAADAINAAIEVKDANESLKKYDTVDFKAGAIRYSGRNYEWNIFSQDYTPIGPPTWGIKPYVCFRWRGSGGTGTGDTDSGGGSQDQGGIDTGTPIGDGGVPSDADVDTGTPIFWNS